jgi:hypothetical protein
VSSTIAVASANPITSIAISGDGTLVVIGVIADQMAYLYAFDGSVWASAITFQPASTLNIGSFGSSIDVSDDGNVIAIGSHNANVTVANGGGVWLSFNNNSTWSQVSLVTVASLVGNDNAGAIVKLTSNGDTLVTATNTYGISVIPINPQLPSVGTSTTFLTGDTSAGLGIGLDISGDGSFIIAGVYNYISNPLIEGAVYVFESVSNTYLEREHITISAIPATNVKFGRSLSITNNGFNAVTSNYHETEAGVVNAGAIYTLF